MAALSGPAAMITLIHIERAARALAESRVPGSTRPGGHYHLSESWRALIQRQARVDLEREPQIRVDAPLAA